jgi:bifunctional DNA-binding transcriptional regulator/antitoxin component of YhaV-PrlF toxin-antitoxin module
MATIDVTRMSSKGQVIIPARMRYGMKKGQPFVVIRNKSQIILKKADDFDSNISEDLKFAERTEKALKAYQKGKPTPKSKEAFLAELDTW